jgi:hypothetical protein
MGSSGAAWTSGSISYNRASRRRAKTWASSTPKPPPPKPVGSPWAVARWPKDLRDEWEERAAIIEYDAGEPRPVAERQAYEIVRTIMRLRFTWQRK